MPSDQGARPEGSRTRAGRTKRRRTRAALLAAADAAFDVHGWSGTRVEDVAVAAGVSPATAYNHFPTKHVLVAHVFGPLVTPLVARAEEDLAAGRPVADALTDQVHALVRTTSRRRVLAAAYLAACQEYATRVHGPPHPADELDPRNLAPVADAVRLLVAAGQAAGELRPTPDAADIAGMVTTLLLVRSVEAPDEPAETTAELLLAILFGALRPP